MDKTFRNKVREYVAKIKEDADKEGMDKFEFLKIIYDQCMKDWDAVQQEKKAMSGLFYNIKISVQQYMVIL